MEEEKKNVKEYKRIQGNTNSNVPYNYLNQRKDSTVEGRYGRGREGNEGVRYEEEDK